MGTEIPKKPDKEGVKDHIVLGEKNVRGNCLAAPRDTRPSPQRSVFHLRRALKEFVPAS